MIYSIGQELIYSSLGVYKILDIRLESALGTERTYYVMCEMGDSESSLVYVPVDSDAEKRLLRQLISKEEAEDILKNYSDIPAGEWDDNSRTRQLMHKSIIDSTDRRSLVGLIKIIEEKQNCRIAAGKKPFLTDEHTYQRAVKLLTSELSAVLNRTEEDIKNELFACVK